MLRHPLGFAALRRDGMHGDDILLLGIGIQPPWQLVDQHLETSTQPHELHLQVAGDFVHRKGFKYCLFNLSYSRITFLSTDIYAVIKSKGCVYLWESTLLSELVRMTKCDWVKQRELKNLCTVGDVAPVDRVIGLAEARAC